MKGNLFNTFQYKMLEYSFFFLLFLWLCAWSKWRPRQWLSDFSFSCSICRHRHRRFRFVSYSISIFYSNVTKRHFFGIFNAVAVSFYFVTFFFYVYLFCFVFIYYFFFSFCLLLNFIGYIHSFYSYLFTAIDLNVKKEVALLHGQL